MTGAAMIAGARRRWLAWLPRLNWLVARGPARAPTWPAMGGPPPAPRRRPAWLGWVRRRSWIICSLARAGRRPLTARWPAVPLVLTASLVLVIGGLSREVWRGAEERAVLLARAAVMTGVTQAREQLLAARLAAMTATAAGQADELATLEALLTRQRAETALLERALAEASDEYDRLQRTYQARRLAAEARARVADERAGQQQAEVARLGAELEQRDAELARLAGEIEALGRKVVETEALTKRVRQTLGLPAPTGPAGGDEPLPPSDEGGVATAADLTARLAAIQERALAADRDLAEAERQLRQRVYALRQLTAASQPLRLGAATLALAPTGRPAPGAITSGFGMRLSPIDGELRFHGGIDLGTPFGTPVRATREGEVILAGTHRGYGLAVIIRHAGGFQTLYGHLSRLEVRPGQRVERGQVIARSGNSGASSGPHLHYEVHYQGRQLDPAPLVNLP